MDDCPHPQFATTSSAHAEPGSPAFGPSQCVGLRQVSIGLSSPHRRVDCGTRTQVKASLFKEGHRRPLSGASRGVGLPYRITSALFCRQLLCGHTARPLSQSLSLSKSCMQSWSMTSQSRHLFVISWPTEPLHLGLPWPHCPRSTLHLGLPHGLSSQSRLNHVAGAYRASWCMCCVCGRVATRVGPAVVYVCVRGRVATPRSRGLQRICTARARSLSLELSHASLRMHLPV